MRRLLSCLLCSLGIASLVGAGHASPTPPPTGDWIIVKADGPVDITGELLQPEGNVVVDREASLTLRNCTLDLNPGKHLWSYGELDFNLTSVTTDPGAITVFDTGWSAVNRFTDCDFYMAEFRLRGGSTNEFLRCTFARATEGVNGYTAAGSTNTFTDCIMNGFSFMAPSVSLLNGCEFQWTDPAWGGRAILYTDGTSTTIELADLAPGYQEHTVITDPINGFHVEMNDSTVASFSLITGASSQWRLVNCDLQLLSCTDWSETELVDCHLGTFTVEMQRQGQHGPVNVLADGFRDDGTALNTTIWSDNSPFRVVFQNTDILGAKVGHYHTQSMFWLGDNGGETGSSNTIDNSVIETLSSREHSSLLVRNSTVTSLSLGSDYPGATAQVVAEGCDIKHVTLGGLATRIALRDSLLCTFNFRTYFEGDAPELAFESSEVAPWFPGSVAQVSVGSGFNGARVSGTVTIGPPEDVYVYQWRPGSTIIRSYPLLVKRPNGQPVAGAAVEVTHPPDPTIWWSGVTDAEGLVYPEVTFDDTNYGTEFTVTAAQGGASESAPLTFLCSTPIELVLPVVYQLQWVPPLHDGTSAESPDGPFKCGRTIPVKFRLLDADGQPLPDEEAEALTATLQVFYEAPCDQGIPTDPGDAEPDTGSEFRYVADDDLFIYNLSTKDPAWIADYTYGLEVLIDGSPVGEVYFSLR